MFIYFIYIICKILCEFYLSKQKNFKYDIHRKEWKFSRFKKKCFEI